MTCKKMTAIPETRREHHLPLIAVADVELVGHADAAVKMDRLLSYETAVTAGCRFASRDQSIPIDLMLCPCPFGSLQDRTDLLHGDMHIREAMTQNLEFREGLAERTPHLKIRFRAF